MSFKRLPDSIQLPGLQRVPIQLVSPATLHNHFAHDEQEGVEEYQAAFIYQEGKPYILINNKLGVKDQWKRLYHEMKHYLVDIYDDMLHEVIQPWKQ